MAEDLSVYYTYDAETKKYIGANQSQIDPLESEIAGKTVYCGLPQNATYEKPLKEKEGYDIIWRDTQWVYREVEKEPEPEEPSELDKARETYYKALNALESTDYRALKYIDGEYTDEEYEVYKQERAQLRQAVRDAEARMKELEE